MAMSGKSKKSGINKSREILNELAAITTYKMRNLYKRCNNITKKERENKLADSRIKDLSNSSSH